jgi:hypothetical protein
MRLLLASSTVDAADSEANATKRPCWSETASPRATQAYRLSDATFEMRLIPARSA